MRAGLNTIGYSMVTAARLMVTAALITGLSGVGIETGVAAADASATASTSLLAAETPTDPIPQTRAAAQACGTVLVAGSAWLGGTGVDVHSNGATQGGSSCGGISVMDRAVQNGGGWQCVELAARLYHVKGWGIVYAGGNGGARYIPEGSPWLQFHPNGSGYTPVPGDLVVEAYGNYGHVTVVDQVQQNSILAVEQNASITGRKVYGWSGFTASGAYRDGIVRGFIHSPSNTSQNSAASPPTTIAAGRVKVTRRHLRLRWAPVDPAQASKFVVQLRRRDVRSGLWSGGVSLAAGARRFRIEITHGKVYRLRVAAYKGTSQGPWWTSRTLRP